MAGSCGGTCVKLLLALFNFIWLAVGGFFVYIGIRIFQIQDDLRELVKENLSTGAMAVTIFGAAVVLIAAIGFIGACCESSALLNFYGFVLLLLICVNVAGMYFGYKYQPEFEKSFDEGVSNGIQRFKDDKKLAYALQVVQSNLQCCGWEGIGDYKGIFLTEDVPSSCCKETNYSLEEPDKTCSGASARISGYSTGCKESPVVKQITGNLTYTSIALILIQLVVILAACCLARDLKANY
ncbi:cd63 antigen [Tyrophagus putrescentiae]|nr:cd63 antigen [Tyrophagus putrescentiae]